MPDAKFVKTLEDNHHFPEMVIIKVIGRNAADFVAEVLTVVCDGLRLKFEPRHQLRVTPNQKHVSITVEAIAGTADDLALTYEQLCKVNGAVMVL